MSLVLQSSGGGSVALTEPTTASNFTVTFPAGTGTVAVTGVSSNIVQGTSVASTSGTAIDFTGIPSWVNRITVMFQGVSTSGGSIIQIQLGSGTVTTTGYSSGGAGVGNAVSTTAANSTTGMLTGGVGAAADVRHGAFTISNLSGNTWVMQGSLGLSSAAYVHFGNGSVTLAGALDRVRVTTVNGTDTFDAGNINIMWE